MRLIDKNCSHCKKRLKKEYKDNNHGYAITDKKTQSLILLCKKCFDKDNKKYNLVGEMK